MILSTPHSDARDATARTAANAESWARLSAGADTPVVQLWSGTPEAPGALLATIPMADPPGTFDAGTHLTTLTTPIEGQVTTAGDAGFGVIIDSNEADYGSLTVSATGGAGELELESISLLEGAFARITSGTIQG